MGGRPGPFSLGIYHLYEEIRGTVETVGKLDVRRFDTVAAADHSCPVAVFLPVDIDAGSGTALHVEDVVFQPKLTDHGSGGGIECAGIQRMD